MAQTIQELLKDGPSGGQTMKYLNTVQAYDRWAEVYDTDGNFLQRLDTIEMRALLPQFLDRINARFLVPAKGLSRTTLVDLGCGTGRNTILLVDTLSSDAGAGQFEIVGLDASSGMLDVARATIKKHVGSDNPRTNVSLEIFDLLQPNLEQLPASLRNPTDGAVGVISTLVLEHIPLQQYFAAASAIMRAGAYLLVTNMHADMGMRSQAGFTDPATGVKIRPTSYCHQIGDVLAVAAEAGFQVENVVGCNEDGVLVRGVDKALGEILGARAKKWVGVRVWFGVCFSKK